MFGSKYNYDRFTRSQFAEPEVSQTSLQSLALRCVAASRFAGTPTLKKDFE